MTDILSLDATDQIAKLATREISSRELVEAAVRRTNQLHTRFNAVIARDLDRAFSRAKEIDDRRTRGEHIGVLGGLPMTVKDTLDVEGLPGTAGMPELLDRNCSNATAVQSVFDQDGNIWGKTNMSYKGGDTQSHNALYGTTNNPWDVSRTCGGSSGGSAVALATGMTALEIGSDIGGSLRCPASFCGVFSHKPTFGLVSQQGLVPPVSRAADIDMAVVGPMARSVRDLSLLLPILAGNPDIVQAPTPDLRKLRLGLWLEEPSFSLDPLVRSPIEDFADRLDAAGVTVDKIQCPINADQMLDAYIVLLFSQGMHDLSTAQYILYELLRPAALTALRAGAGPISWANGIKALTARHSDWMAANEVRARLQHAMRVFFESYDGIIAPVVPVPAFPHTQVPLEIRKLTLSTGQRVPYLEMIKWIALATLCGLPATSLPAGKSQTGLPVGVQLIGAHGTDMRMLGIAEAMEQQLGGFETPPFELSED